MWIGLQEYPPRVELVAGNYNRRTCAMDSTSYEVTGTMMVKRHNSHPPSNVCARKSDTLESIGQNVYWLTRSDGKLKVDIAHSDFQALLANGRIRKLS